MDDQESGCVRVRRARFADLVAIVGALQLTYIPGLSRRGALRAQIEAVRIDARLRGQGLGTRLIDWAFAEAREHGCSLVQLTSDRDRPEAHRFYARMGFVASHEGFKLALTDGGVGEGPP